MALPAQLSPSYGLVIKLALLYHLSLTLAMVKLDVQSGLDGSEDSGFPLRTMSWLLGWNVELAKQCEVGELT